MVPRSLAHSLRGYLNALGIAADVLRDKVSSTSVESYELTMAKGRDVAENRVSVVFAGVSTDREWCLSTAIEHIDELETTHHTTRDSLANELLDARSRSDIVFADGALGLRPAGTNLLRLPTWVRQRVSVDPDWKRQLSGLRRPTRQEIVRVLRKFDYRCRLSAEPRDADDFFETLYRPHVAARHGNNALIVDRARFLRECRRGNILQLIAHGTVVAAALLRPVGSTMAVVWSGALHSEATAGLRGMTDALDYFSLLYAHKTGSRWLDLGRSRPDLRNGLLRYKRKWGAEVTAGFVPQPTMSIDCCGDETVARNFLCRNAFLTRHGRQFTSLVFVNSIGDAATLEEILKQIATTGISEYRVISKNPVSGETMAAIAEVPYTVTLQRADSVPSALAIAMVH